MAYQFAFLGYQGHITPEIKNTLFTELCKTLYIKYNMFTYIPSLFRGPKEARWLWMHLDDVLVSHYLNLRCHLNSLDLPRCTVIGQIYFLLSMFTCR